MIIQKSRSFVQNLTVLLFCAVWVPGSSINAQIPPSLNSSERGPPVQIEEDPFLTIGSSSGDPDQELFRVVTPFLLPNGNVVVPMGASCEIRVYNRAGELVSIFGRKGEGPGEFRNLDEAWAHGDTIEAFDDSLRRVTRFHPSGAIETITLHPGRAGIRLAEAIPGHFRDGWLFVGLSRSTDSGRFEYAIAHYSRNGDFVEVLAHIEGPEIYSALRVNGAIPLSPHATYSVKGDALYLGETLTPTIRVLGGNGRLVRELTWEPAPVVPKDAHRQVIELAVQRADPGERQRLRARLEQAPQPEKVPTFSGLMVDDLGFVWVRPFEVLRDAFSLGGPPMSLPAGGSWWIFTPGGEQVGTVEVPDGLEPHQITADAVIGIRRDELGVEYVQVHRLHRRATAGPSGQREGSTSQ